MTITEKYVATSDRREGWIRHEQKHKKYRQTMDAGRETAVARACERKHTDAGHRTEARPHARRSAVAGIAPAHVVETTQSVSVQPQEVETLKVCRRCICAGTPLISDAYQSTCAFSNASVQKQTGMRSARPRSGG